MKAILAKQFGGYDGLELVEMPKPSGEGVLVRVAAAGVTPLEHTILSGAFPRAKAPLVLGNEGAGMIMRAGIPGPTIGTRVAFTGGYGVVVNGSWAEYVLVHPDDLLPVPDDVSDVVAASLPVAYLTAYITLAQAGFEPGKTVFAPAIGGSVGNATYQLAKALGASAVISTAGSPEKAAQAQSLGYEKVIDLSAESIRDGVRRMTEGRGADIVIESLGGAFTGASLGVLAPGGTLVTLGYSAGTKAAIDVTDLIWKGARMFGFMLAAQTPAIKQDAWKKVMALVASGAIKPLVEQTYPLEQAADALRHLHERRPFGKIVLEL